MKGKIGGIATGIIIALILINLKRSLILSLDSMDRMVKKS